MQCNDILNFSNFPFQVDHQNHDVPISTCKFSDKKIDIAAVANENGIVCLQNVKKISQREFVQTHKNTVYDIAWVPRKTQFITVSGDNSAKLWDCTQADVSLISVFRGHKRSVRCVSFKSENTAVFATGSRDGSLMIWDVRAQNKCTKLSYYVPDQVIPWGAGSPSTGIKYNSRKNGQTSESLSSKSVTGVVFQNDNTLISCGSLDNVIRVWDMRKTYSRSTSNSVAKYQLYSPHLGFSYICMNSAQTKLFANCMDSYIYCFDINSYDPDPVAAFYGHENGSFYVKSCISTDGEYLMSGSSDEAAYIWNTKSAELSDVAIKPFVTLKSHMAEVTSVEISPDKLVIVTCSDDGTFRLWNSLTNEEDIARRIDRAECYDEGNVLPVKTQWKNKRKLSRAEESKEDDTKTEFGFIHSKICRFYSANLSSTCICQNKIGYKLGHKRASEECLKEAVTAKKKAFLIAQEHTPPKQEVPKYFVHSRAVGDITPERNEAWIPVRFASKRKLENTPSFAEEINKCKRLNSSRILTPCNIPSEGGERKKIVGEDSNKCSKLKDEKERLWENRKGCSTLDVSSPTSNLPNYIKDGTSPYIHRCSRTVTKENDWLTKLQEVRRRENKISEQLKRVHASSPVAGIDLPKKRIKCTDHTLHKYFKVASKTIDKSFSLQEIQKENNLASPSPLAGTENPL